MQWRSQVAEGCRSLGRLPVFCRIVGECLISCPKDVEKFSAEADGILF
jgi:hypothetical protein